MIKNTIYVIGAGASKEANLPTGDELKGKISTLLNFNFDHFGRRLEGGDNNIINALNHHVRQHNGDINELNSYLHEAWHIKDALPLAISIDNFIDAHKNNQKIALCGKLGIACSILEAERNSLLRISKNRESIINLDWLSKSWYTHFFQILTENCSKEDLPQRLKFITLIIFNYDRCIEHFLLHALKIYYRIDTAEAADLIKNINIFHPYGCVGSLPWIDKNSSIEFGCEPNYEQLLELSVKIKTFTEGTDEDSSEILSIRSHVSNANKLIFIGFAFHKLNMKLITPTKTEDKKNHEIECFATTYDTSINDGEIIKNQIINLYGRKIKIYASDTTCASFFKEYRRSLSF